MKKVTIVSAFCAVVLSATSYFGNRHASEASESDLFLANVEALSENESGKHKMKCYTSLKFEEGSAVVECTTCKLLVNHTDSWYNLHDWCE